jgi:hypothetical protein
MKAARLNIPAASVQPWPRCAEAAAGGPTTLLQLVPPGTGGVRDFAELLQQRWQDSGVHSELLAFDPHEQPPPVLLRRPGRLAVLLHYSGYGYQRRGLPLALLQQLQQLRLAWGDELRLVSYFHESFASGPPWRSAFWLQGLQSHIGRQVARLSDAVCTNTSAHAAWLAPACTHHATPPRVQPVFAAIAEPSPHAAVSIPRDPVAIVFGAAVTRARALQACARHAPLLRQHGIQRVVEVGGGQSAANQAASPSGSELPLHFLGRLETPDLHALLARCHAGLIDYPASLLAKSSVFAALAAHGVPVLNTRPHDHDADGLRAGEHYLVLPPSPGVAQPSLLDPGQGRAVAEAASGWYRRHDSWQQAARLAALLQGRLDDAEPGLR